MCYRSVKALILSPSHEIWGGGQIYIESLSQFASQCNGIVPIATSEPKAFSTDTVLIPRIETKWKRVQKAFSLARDLRKTGAKRILLNDLSSLWMAPAFRCFGFEVAALLHLYPEPKTAPGIGHTRVERFLLRGGARFCQRLFSVNRQNADIFGRRVTFVGNYAPSEFFEQQSVSDGEAKIYDLIFVARLAPQKDPRTFVSLVESLCCERSKPVRALMVGSGPLEAEVDAMIHAAGLESVIERRSWVDREALPAILDRSRCFVMTSLYEGFATTVIEAHARGLPVVTTETSGFCPEFVHAFGGATGLVFDASTYEPTVLSAQINELIDNSETLAADCRRKAALFTRESVLSPIRDWLVGES